MLRLAEKAFYPAKIPFPLLQVDTGLDFDEVLETRDNWVNRLGVRLMVASVTEAIDNGFVIDDCKTSRNRMKTAILLDAIEKNRSPPSSAARDATRTRHAQRSGSTPTATTSASGTPEAAARALEPLQRPDPPRRAHADLPAVELDRLADIWEYLGQEGVELPSIYYSHHRRVFNRDGMWLTENELLPVPRRARRSSRRRSATAPSATRRLTAAVDSDADTVEKVIEEVAVARVTERGATRGDDKFSEAAMEDRKSEGYF